MEAGCPVDATDDAENTPLHLAAGGPSSCSSLSDSHCRPDAADQLRCFLWLRCLTIAGCGFIETVEVLIELGADINARDITACTPLQNAAHGTYSALAAMPSNQQPGMPLPYDLLTRKASCYAWRHIFSMR